MMIHALIKLCEYITWLCVLKFYSKKNYNGIEKRSLTIRLNATKVLIAEDNLDDINKNELSNILDWFIT